MKQARNYILYCTNDCIYSCKTIPPILLINIPIDFGRIIRTCGFTQESLEIPCDCDAAATVGTNLKLSIGCINCWCSANYTSKSRCISICSYVNVTLFSS